MTDGAIPDGKSLVTARSSESVGAGQLRDSAVVTGAGRGIGRAIAVALAKRGLDVALLGRTVQDLDDVVREIASVAPLTQPTAFACDVASEDEVTATSTRVLEQLGSPRVVVNNAGIVHRALVEATSLDAWERVISVNLTAPFLISRAFVAAMKRARRGRIVHIASISATLGTPGASSYCASKWGLVGFMKSLAEELRGTDVQTMAVLPGSVDTDMLIGSGFAPQMTAEDVAGTVAYVALDAPAAMHGAAVELFGAE